MCTNTIRVVIQLLFDEVQMKSIDLGHQFSMSLKLSSTDRFCCKPHNDYKWTNTVPIKDSSWTIPLSIPQEIPSNCEMNFEKDKCFIHLQDLVRFEMCDWESPLDGFVCHLSEANKSCSVVMDGFIGKEKKCIVTRSTEFESSSNYIIFELKRTVAEQTGSTSTDKSIKVVKKPIKIPDKYYLLSTTADMTVYKFMSSIIHEGLQYGRGSYSVIKKHNGQCLKISNDKTSVIEQEEYNGYLQNDSTLLLYEKMKNDNVSSLKDEIKDSSKDSVKPYPEFPFTDDVKYWDSFFREPGEKITSTTQRLNLKRKSSDEHFSDSNDNSKRSNKLKFKRCKSISKVSSQTNTLTQTWNKVNSQEDASYYTQSMFTSSSSFKQRNEHRPCSMLVTVISRRSVEKVYDDAITSKCITCSSWTEEKIGRYTYICSRCEHKDLRKSYNNMISKNGKEEFNCLVCNHKFETLHSKGTIKEYHHTLGTLKFCRNCIQHRNCHCDMCNHSEYYPYHADIMDLKFLFESKSKDVFKSDCQTVQNKLSSCFQWFHSKGDLSVVEEKALRNML